MALDQALGDRKRRIAQEALMMGLAAPPQPGERPVPTLSAALSHRVATVLPLMPKTALMSLSITPAEAEYMFSQYVNAPHVSHYIKKIPTREWFDPPKLLTTVLTILRGYFSQLIEHTDVRGFDRWERPQEYDKFFSDKLPALLKMLGLVWVDAFYKPVLAVGGSWADDVVWAEQFLSGPNPTLICKVTREEAPQLLNDFFPLRPGFMANNQDRAHRIAMLVQMGSRDEGRMDPAALFDRLYVVDHEMLLKAAEMRHLNSRDKAYIHAPKTLLFATPKGRLAPLALWVRKCQGPHVTEDALKALRPTPERLFYPDSPAAVWMFAKMCVGNADANQHELVAHLGFTHLLTEAIVIASTRTFAGQGFGKALSHGGQINDDPNKDHPVFRVLRPHFHRTLMINQQGRGTLMTPGPGGLFSLDQVTSLGVVEGIALIDQSFERLKWDEQVNMVANLTNRGFDPEGPCQLSRFYYRDFGFKVWKVMHTYVDSSLRRGFQDNGRDLSDPELDELVRHDHLLQNWCRCTRGPLNTTQGNVPSFPKSIDQFKDLVTLCTTIMWTASAQHAAVNFSQYDYVSSQSHSTPAQPAVLAMHADG